MRCRVIYKMTVSIPKELKAEMDAVGEQVNWSAVAKEAFQRKVAEVRSGRNKAMTKAKVIERLRKAGQEDPFGFEAGRAAGRKWAEDKALPRHIRNLARDPDWPFAEYISPDDEEQLPWSLSSKLALVLERGSGDWPAFWDKALGPEGSRLIDSEDFARGFVAGALEVWAEVGGEL
jgi:hypothetical protein